MKNFTKMFLLLGLVGALFALTPPAPAGFSNVWVQVSDADTLTNTESDTITFEKAFDYPSDLAITWNTTELSGTATVLVTVQQAICATCTDRWITTDTLNGAALSATGSHKIMLTQNPDLSGENDLWGYRARIVATGTGTGAYRYLAALVGRRRNM